MFLRYQKSSVFKPDIPKNIILQINYTYNKNDTAEILKLVQPPSIANGTF